MHPEHSQFSYNGWCVRSIYSHMPKVYWIHSVFLLHSKHYGDHEQTMYFIVSSVRQTCHFFHEIYFYMNEWKIMNIDSYFADIFSYINKMNINLEKINEQCSVSLMTKVKFSDKNDNGNMDCKYELDSFQYIRHCSRDLWCY
jgi:hypothetical protein